MGLLDTLRSRVHRPELSRRALMATMMLSIVFTIAILIRAYSAKYGYYLNEFDPYYDYFAAQHVVNLAQSQGLWNALFANPSNCGPTVYTACHNLQGYFYWHDITTWYPVGRNVAATSQGGLQLFGALTYLLIHNIFGVQISLYDWLVIMPVLLGALTSIVFYFLVRKIAGDAAGLFAALIFAVSPPLIQRGNLGWFKSEPLAILLFVAASYLMLTVFDKERTVRSRILRGLFGGVLIGYANTAWGGGDYFSAAFGLIFVLIPFLNLDLSGYTPAIISFTAFTLFVSSIFPRPGVAIVTNPVGLVLIGGTLFTLVGQWAKTWTKPTEYRSTMIKFLFGFGLAGLTVLSFGLVGGLSLRYLSAIAPWARSGNPLVESVAEHFVPTGADYFTSYAIILCFGMAGAVVAFRRRGIPMIYALVFGLSGLYFSAAFSRLLVYSSIALGILGGIGFAELAYAIVKPSTTPLVKKAKQVPTSRNEMKVVFSIAVIALIVLPAGSYWIPNPVACTYSGQLFCNNSPADAGVSIVNGATVYSRSPFTDWIQTLSWVRQNTPTNSIIISWWDYGYWFAVMGNRTTVVDNATLNSTRIEQVGQLLMSNSTQSAAMAKQMAYIPGCTPVNSTSCYRPAYVAIFITGSIFPLTDQTTGAQTNYYLLQVPGSGGFTAGGGDESKKQWFIRIGNLTESKYLECSGTTPNELTPAGTPCETVDDFNLTPYAMTNSLFGQLLPFQLAGYLYSVTQNSQTSIQLANSYTYGTNNAPPVEAFSYPSSYTFSANSTSLFRLAYVSPSLAAAEAGNSPCPGDSALQCFNTILLYQVLY
ncbi:MAG TPA: STT3 domain-containing protein [Nitrososphaerales archaeon]|nr:STT3 domain-containing protein [Nitrososphaerales archaeon]